MSTTFLPHCRVRDLSTLQYANGFTLWHYKTDLTLAVVNDNGFFNEASDLFAVGDHIHVSSPSFGALLFVAGIDKDGVRTVPMCATPAQGFW